MDCNKKDRNFVAHFPQLIEKEEELKKITAAALVNTPSINATLSTQIGQLDSLSNQHILSLVALLVVLLAFLLYVS